METVLKYGVKIRIKCIIKTSEIYLTFIHAQKTYCKFAIMDPSVEDVVMGKGM